MRYMLLIYRNEKLGPPTTDEGRQMRDGHWAVMDETTKLGIFRGAEPLEPSSTATTIRRQDGKLVTLDGPFAETKEQLAGYYILDCNNLDEAISWAAKLPLVSKDGQECIEIRPIRPVPPRDEARDGTQYATQVNG